MRNRLRALRAQRGLSQRELGRRCGLTRHAVGAIEAGHYVPNTATALRLARALGCRVEALFHLDPPGPEREVHAAAPLDGGAIRALVARVGERLVAHPLTTGRALQEGFATADALVRDRGANPSARLLVEPERLERTALVLGCDPSLSVLVGHMGRRGLGGGLAWLPATSRRALEALGGRLTHLAGCHLRDPEGKGGSAEYNVSYAREVLAPEGGLLVTLAAWEQGLVLAPGNPKGISSPVDLARPDVGVVNREPGAGARQLLDEHLGRAGISGEHIRGYDREVGSHLAVARAIAIGGADAGIALQAAADAYGLDFVPLSQVRFDLVVPNGAMDHPAVPVLLDLLQARPLREELGALPGYEVQETGRVVAEIPRAEAEGSAP